MKLLFDQDISQKLTNRLSDIFPNSGYKIRKPGNSSTKYIEELIGSNALAIQHLNLSQKVCLELF
jgi:hypothetical protein